MAKTQGFKNSNIYLMIAAVMMLILFIASSQTFEQQDQTGNLVKILDNQPFFDQVSKMNFNYGGSEVSLSNSSYYGVIQFFLRKAAHFMSFFIIGGSAYLGLLPRLRNMGLTAVVSWLAATGYAALDEYHQLLTGGRSPLFEDIVLDSSGAATAIGICLLVTFIKYLRKGR